MGVAGTPATTERTARGVRTTRWIVDRPPPPMLARLGGFTGNIDRWQIVDFIAPGAVILDVGGAPTGTGVPEGDRSRGMSNCNLNAITPETETSLHQFWAQAHSASLTMPDITEGMHDQVPPAARGQASYVESTQIRIARPDCRPASGRACAGRRPNRRAIPPGPRLPGPAGPNAPHAASRSPTACGPAWRR